jgi:quercetin dioxygenase-like cupin family protein
MKNCKSACYGIGRASLAFAVSVFSAVSFAQVTAPGFVSKPMQVSPISGIEDKEAAFINVSMEPGASSPRHTHPGDCYGAVLEGTVELFIEGQESRRFDAGQAWHNPRGPVHYFKNVGSTPARLVNTLIVDKGKPRTVVEKAAEK